MEAEFSCSICLEIADRAVETSCCHHIFCEGCLSKMIGKGCPQCRSSFDIIVSHIGRRVIGNMKTECGHPNCGTLLTRSALNEHERTCHYRIFSCSSLSCEFTGVRNDYVSHLFSVHVDQIVENSMKIIRRADDPHRINNFTGEESIDRIIKRKHSAGRYARLGGNSKYYCGGNIGAISCTCCDGICGPINGCNCKPCMELDVNLRKLPRNWFVNKDGAACRISDETGQFYCGRKVVNISITCDGWCGPTIGPNCPACQCIQLQYHSRYAGVW